jgi:hypothetical protein
MKLIPLTQGKFAQVDDDMFEFLNKFKWHLARGRTTNYAEMNHWYDKKVTHSHMHHVIAGFPLNSGVVDHLDGNGLNNQRDNLRIVTNRKNLQNQSIHRNGRLVGCSMLKKKYKDKVYIYFIAHIWLNGAPKYLGSFKTEQEAHDRYLQEIEKRGLK